MRLYTVFEMSIVASVSLNDYERLHQLLQLSNDTSIAIDRLAE